jgi:ubiquinone/menaquinone biosynthesis C-methylase UbiE
MQSVKERYAAAAKVREGELCCPVNYDPSYLEAIPKAVIERDYGCGDPSRFVREGDTVLDLGAGGGKACFIAAQIVGPSGRVIGVDMTDEMLELARGNQATVAANIGFDNVDFRHGNIQDLRTDLDLVDAYLREHPLASARDYKSFQDYLDKIRREAPLIASDSIDVIISNCVLNLVSNQEKLTLFREMYRVLKLGGSIAVSDIISDEESPEHLKANPELWSGCVSGALQEHAFLRFLEDAGFYGIEIAHYEQHPWRVVEGIEYRSATITAMKGKEGPCFEKNQAVIYKGPWKRVEDDDGHVYERGERMAVCAKTFDILTKSPYAQAMIPVPPHEEITTKEVFDCSGPVTRSPEVTKRGTRPVTTSSCGDNDSPCC